MIKQAFAKNYMPSGGGGNYKYYKINNSEILEFILEIAKMPVIDVIAEGEVHPILVVPPGYRGDNISALRTDNSYHYSINISDIIEKPDTYISVTGDLIKTIKSTELFSTSREELEIFSMFQEISKEEYEAMITK